MVTQTPKRLHEIAGRTYVRLEVFQFLSLLSVFWQARKLVLLLDGLLKLFLLPEFPSPHWHLPPWLQGMRKYSGIPALVGTDNTCKHNQHGT